MQEWPRKIWQAFFLLLYPFLTLFSVLFTGLIRLFSASSAGLAGLFKPATEPSSQPSGSPDQKKVIKLGQDRLVFIPLKEVLFGPTLYQLQYAPAYMSRWLGKAFGEWEHTYHRTLLLQHWPQTEEHLLGNYELVVVDTEQQTAQSGMVFTDFAWEVRVQARQLKVVCPSTRQELILKTGTAPYAK